MRFETVWAGLVILNFKEGLAKRFPVVWCVVSLDLKSLGSFWALLRLCVFGDLQVVFVGSKSPFGIAPITLVLSV